MKADEALAALKEGNIRYVKGDLKHPHTDSNYRETLTEGQHPIAVVLSCADSRVVPELLFDQGLGDLFVIRVAGNVAKEKVLGSIEYAVKFLGTKLIVVLGHENCGAVNASLSADVPPSSHLAVIIESIKPAVHIARSMEGDLLTNSIKLNTQMVTGHVKEAHPIINEAVKADGVKVVPAFYKMKEGEVEWL